MSTVTMKLMLSLLLSASSVRAFAPLSRWTNQVRAFAPFATTVSSDDTDKDFENFSSEVRYGTTHRHIYIHIYEYIWMCMYYHKEHGLYVLIHRLTYVLTC